MKVFAAAMVLAMGAAAAAAPVEVRVNEVSVVESARITVGDVATVAAGRPAEGAELAAAVIGWVPEGADSITLRSNTLERALSGAGFNTAAVKITGFSEFVVKRAEPVTGGSAGGIMAAVRSYLDAASPFARFTASGLELDFDARGGLRPVVTAVRPAAEAGEVRFDIADAADPDTVVGHAFATLSESVCRVRVRRRVPGGRVLTLEDIEIDYVSAAEGANAFGDTSEVIGRRALFALSEGQAVTEECLRKETVVKRGDRVMLEMATGGLTVSVKTEALEKGAVGEIIRLVQQKVGGDGRKARRSPGAGARYLARVVGAGRAVPVDGGGQ